MNKFIVIAILAVVIFMGFLALPLDLPGGDVKLDILGEEFPEGGTIFVKVCSDDGTPLNNKFVDVIFLGKYGKDLPFQSSHTIPVDSNGKVKISTEGLTEGTYTLKVTFAGDDVYNYNQTTKKIRIVKEGS